MKILVCITKMAEVEVDLDEAREYLVAARHNTTGWSDKTIAEVFVEVAEDLDPEFETNVTAVTQFAEEES